VGRHRLGAPGIISVVALCFAVVGGAVASQGGDATASKTKVGPRGPKGAKGAKGAPGAAGPVGPVGPVGPSGPSGPSGPQGDAGPQGLAGQQGIQGVPGTPGANGKSVLNGTSAPTAGTGTNGDFFINTTTSEIYGPKTGAGWGSPTSLKGPPGPVIPLPSGQTETGAWSATREPQIIDADGKAEAAPFAVTFSPITFAIQLAAGLASTNVHFVDAAGKEQPGSVDPVTCLGSAATPTAPAGHLCIYTGQQSGAHGVAYEFAGVEKTGPVGEGTSVAGGILKLGAIPEFSAMGSWAVKAP
jgi:Collagen triple helix repeat (20 copies)